VRIPSGLLRLGGAFVHEVGIGSVMFGVKCVWCAKVFGGGGGWW